ncbi:MAG: hypothetical protein A2Z21_05415, partial [Candidatus Fraserbacteria bacterium RBG_16_55_9]
IGCALLNSESGQLLSAGSWAYLASHCGLWAQEKLINDRTTDKFPNITQSETAIAVYDIGFRLLGDESTNDGIADQVVIAWNDAGVRSGGIGYATSKTAGLLFTDQGNILDLPGADNCCDPGVAVDSFGIYYLGLVAFRPDLTTTIGVARMLPVSFPTFGVPVEIPGIIEGDRPHIVANPFNGGRAWVCFTEFGVRDGDAQIMLSFTKDAGVSWFQPFIVGGTGREQVCRMAVGPKKDEFGRADVYITWENFLLTGARTFSIRRCAFPCEGPADLGPVVQVPFASSGTGQVADCPDSDLANDPDTRNVMNGFIRTFENPTVAVDRSGGTFNGRVYLVWSHAIIAPGVIEEGDIYFMAFNEDLSQKILPKQINVEDLNEGATGQFMPFITATGKGVVAVAWYDRRNDPVNDLDIDVYMARSYDGGTTFEADERITDTSFGIPPLNPNFNPGIANCYMGDYNEATADKKHVYLAWGGNTFLASDDSTPDPDVFGCKQKVSMEMEASERLKAMALLPMGILFVGAWVAPRRRRWAWIMLLLFAAAFMSAGCGIVPDILC